MDVTGLRNVDTNIASTLISTARALRLLGTETILTGIRAQVAQTLVALGIDLRGIVTYSTLKSAIAYARRTGRSKPAS
jgi:rsbT co-antagonist protein RsbR